MKSRIGIAKCVGLAAFVVLVFVTYFLRSEVLDLNRIRFSSENVRSDEEIAKLKATYPSRLAAYEADMKQYEIKLKHYEEMLKLYGSDYAEYVKRLKDKYHPPVPPEKVEMPRSPETSDKLARINLEFRQRKFEYFDKTWRLNWVACGAAMALVASLLYLLMFDTEGKRIFYVAILILSFVFMIGPSFHTILSVLVGGLRPPPVY